MNRPEDAQDYLWLTQDLWMEFDIWNWANQDAEIKATVQRMCCSDSCGKVETKVAEYKRCAACKTVCLPIVQGQAYLCIHHVYVRYGIVPQSVGNKTGELTKRVTLLPKVIQKLVY